MKMFPSLRYRRFVFAGMLVLALSFGFIAPLFTGSTLQAQTPPPAPSGAASPSPDKDTESGKPIITTPSGLKYVDLVVGTGPAVKNGDHLAVNYVGTLQDGKKFDSSYDRNQPFDLVLGVSQVIQGWTEGLAGMKVGGKRKLIIPPQLGYGQQGAGDVIPPNATLIFQVEIVSDADAK
ncbi:MAG TPA: FKBP-type peptidyl-prolyl cis-trans isomerase [Candidatus Methylacidiphilales bacterium]|nr:FKBP-type peptidyl-prolyl cis-trans isomerase [Candidatus Methylacidiphilales bacterium]